MADDSPRDDPDELAVQADVLSFLLDQPFAISLAELLREMAEPTYGPFTADAVQEATRDLVRAGLLHRQGDFVFPTHAAVRLEQLPHR